MESKVYFNRMYLERVPDAGKKEIKEEYSKYIKEYEKMYGGEVEGNSLLSKVWKWHWRRWKATGVVVYNTTFFLIATFQAVEKGIEELNGVTRDQFGNKVNMWGQSSNSWGNAVDSWGNRVDFLGNRLDGGGKKDFFSEYIEKTKGINWDKNKYFMEGLNNLSKELKELKKDKNNIGITEREGMDISKELDNIKKSGRDIVNKVYKLMTRSEYGILTEDEFNEIRDDINGDNKLQKELERIL